MILSEILDEISEKSNHVLSPSSVIRKVNYVQGNLFRNYVNTNTLTKLDLLAGLSEYPLPSPMGTIIDVLVDGKPYDYGELNVDICGNFYYIIDGTIGLSTVPVSDISRGLVIFHKKAPKALSINDLNASPDLDSNYHMILVFGALLEIVADQNKLEEYQVKYDVLLRQFERANVPPSYPQMKVVFDTW